ncbi:neuropeptides capa receptor-like [Lepeophtheirus salmonis]|uniref:neuropeptides capa receptor-like n=1 Tax=Lepeophtheirus salmonis TaxID=72036 RepID=UPI003AF363DA
MFITGILGNILVIYVIFYHKNLRSPTNAFLVSLAVSDISLLFVGLPNDLHIFWQQYPWLFGTSVCKIRAMVSEMTSNSSVLTIVAFTIERYIAICHPLQSYKISSLSRSNKLITYIWIVSILASIPYAYFTQIHYMKNPHSNQNIMGSAFCSAVNMPRYIFELSLLFFFLIPMIIMLALYSLMGSKMRKKNNELGSNLTESVQSQQKRSVFKMLAAVVIAFFICWAPFHTQRLLYVVHYSYWKIMSDGLYQQINEKLFYITGCFYYVSSTVNPVLYNLLSVKFRNAFRQTLCGRKAERLSQRNTTCSQNSFVMRKPTSDSLPKNYLKTIREVDVSGRRGS